MAWRGTRGDVEFLLAGPGLEWRLLTSALEERASARDALHATGDPERGEWDTTIVQACAPEDAAAPLAYVVRVTREAPEEAASGSAVCLLYTSPSPRD